MYIAKREGFAGTWDYFQDNINDSPKWTKERSKARRFVTESDALKHSKNIVWIGYENDTIHTYYPNTINITNYYEWKQNKPFTGVLSNVIGYAARCETRKNAHYLDKIPAFIFSNK